MSLITTPDEAVPVDGLPKEHSSRYGLVMYPSTEMLTTTTSSNRIKFILLRVANVFFLALNGLLLLFFTVPIVAGLTGTEDLFKMLFSSLFSWWLLLDDLKFIVGAPVATALLWLASHRLEHEGRWRKIQTYNISFALVIMIGVAVAILFAPARNY